MSEAGAPGVLRLAVLRRWRVGVSVAVLAAVALTVLQSTQPRTTYAALAGYLVSSVRAENPALVSSNTDRAARDYASVLSTDDGLMAQLAEAVGTSPKRVRADLKVGYYPSASTIAVRYTSSHKERVQALFARLDEVLSTSGIPVSNLQPGLLHRVNGIHVTARRNFLNPFPGLGVLLGLLVGLLAALLVERSRPTVAGRGHLRSLTSRSALDVNDHAELELLAVRLLRPLPARVRVVAATPDDHVLAVRLGEAITEAVPLLVETGALPREAADVVVDAGPVEDPVGTAWVVLVACGHPLREVEQVVTALADADDVVLAVTGAVVPVRELALTAP